jgi:hypothetical protein
MDIPHHPGSVSKLNKDKFSVKDFVIFMLGCACACAYFRSKRELNKVLHYLLPFLSYSHRPIRVFVYMYGGTERGVLVYFSGIS